MHTCTHKHTHARTHTHTCTHARTSTHAHTHAHMHTCTRTHTHTHTHSLSLSLVVQQIFSIKGRPANKLIRRGAFKDQHFTDDMIFKFYEEDKVTQKVRCAVLATLRLFRVPTTPSLSLTLTHSHTHTLTHSHTLYLSLLIFEPPPQGKSDAAQVSGTNDGFEGPAAAKSEPGARARGTVFEIQGSA